MNTMIAVSSFLSPIAVLFIGSWLTRAAAQRVIDQAAVMKAAADHAAGAAALAREAAKVVIDAALSTRDQLSVIGDKVDGNFARALADLATARADAVAAKAEATQIRADLVDFRTQVRQMLQGGGGDHLVKETLSTPLPNAAK